MRWICSWVERLSTSALFPSPAINPVAELQLTAITNRRSHRHHIPESLSESRKIPTRFAEDPFYLMRFILGAAEAGFFPGIILYLTYWFTGVERARWVGLFMVANPLSTAIGGPISGLIL